MAVIKSSSAQQPHSHVIDGLVDEIDNLNELIEVYKVALEDEGNKIVSIRQHVRTQLAAALTELQTNRPGNALARISMLFNQI